MASAYWICFQRDESKGESWNAEIAGSYTLLVGENDVLKLLDCALASVEFFCLKKEKPVFPLLPSLPGQPVTLS